MSEDKVKQEIESLRNIAKFHQEISSESEIIPFYTWAPLRNIGEVDYYIDNGFFVSLNKEFVKINEGVVWTGYVEKKHLYETGRDQKLIYRGPHIISVVRLYE